MAGLLGAAIYLAATGVLPEDPLFYLATAAMVGGLWYFADRGGRLRSPVAAPMQALALLAATLIAIWLFGLMFNRLT
jgi:hypothetical protein